MVQVGPVSSQIGGSRGKKSDYHCRRHKKHEFNPWVGKILWRRAWKPSPVFLPGKFHGQWSLAGCSPGGYKESGRTEHECMLHLATLLAEC